MYTFTGSGTKENVIQTGHIVITFNDVNNISIQNRYPETDSEGLANTDTNSQMTFTVTSDITGDTKVNYALGITDIQEGTTLTQDYIKIYLKKGNEVATGFTENKGELISSFKPLYIENVMDSHVLLTDIISGSEVHTYTLKAWIDEKYKLPSTESNTNGTHTSNTTSETFKFKIKGYGTTESIEVLDKSLRRLILGKNNSNVIGVLPEASLQTTYELAGDKSGLYVSTDTNDGSPTYYFRGNNGCSGVAMTQEICTLLGGSRFLSSSLQCGRQIGQYEYEVKKVQNLSKEQCILNGGTYDENAVNNYVSFAGFTWRIVRINEDGSIRLLLSERINNNKTYRFNPSSKNYTYMYYSNSDVEGGIKRTVDTWYNDNLKTYEDYIADTEFCEQFKVATKSSSATAGSVTVPLYSSYTSNFKCNIDENGKGILNLKVGLLIFDEAVHAGGYPKINSYPYIVSRSNDVGMDFWSMSPSACNNSDLRVWNIAEYEYSINAYPVNIAETISLVISLNPDTLATGTGTIDDPYIVS